MNFVGALFVLNFTCSIDHEELAEGDKATSDDEVDAFWALAAFFAHFGINILYRRQQGALQQYTQLFRCYAAAVEPELMSYLHELDFPLDCHSVRTHHPHIRCILHSAFHILHSLKFFAFLHS